MKNREKAPHTHACTSLNISATSTTFHPCTTPPTTPPAHPPPAHHHHLPPVLLRRSCAATVFLPQHFFLSSNSLLGGSLTRYSPVYLLRYTLPSGAAGSPACILLWQPAAVATSPVFFFRLLCSLFLLSQTTLPLHLWSGRDSTSSIAKAPLQVMPLHTTLPLHAVCSTCCLCCAPP